MKKLTNTIGSCIVAITAIIFPIITGIGIASGWFGVEDGPLTHLWFVLLFILCLACTVIEVAVLAFVISNSE